MANNITQIKSGKYSIQFNSNTFKIAFSNGSLNDITFNGIENCKVKSSKTKNGKQITAKNDSQSVKFILSNKGVKITLKSLTDIPITIGGKAQFGSGSDNVFAMSTKKNSKIISTALGPATSLKDDMLFDRLTDSGLVFKGKNYKLDYDWATNSYTFNFTAVSGSLTICVKNGVMANQYGIDYKPMNFNRTFNSPPVGWMTWYAVKFDACEEKVLKNAKWQSENLKEYGANTVWVDWEWYHKDLSGIRDDGVDAFNPDPIRYPNGLKYVSDKIRELGLEPALWIGFTNDGAHNKYTKENPEIIFVDEPIWSGRYFYDYTHPKYLNEFLPMALENVKKWGYNAVKYDTLPYANRMIEKYHDRLYDTSLTTKQAYRKMIEKTREYLGENYYMLSCAALNDDDVLWGLGVFDSARVGGDIFEWTDFLKLGVEKTLRFYPMHKSVFYPDCDNVVMREEFNDLYKSASRIYFVSMLGIPITFGDEFDALDDKRISFIKSCLPVLDIHPKNAYKTKNPKDVLTTNLAINKEWESYNVISLFNTKNNNQTITVSFCELGLEKDKYFIYDYTCDKFLGEFDSEFTIDLNPCESRVLSVRKNLNCPQIISTSRHISQGAMEIENLGYNNGELNLTCNLIKNAEYTITLYIPNGYKVDSDLVKVQDNVYKKTIMPTKSGKHDITIKFN